MENEKESARYKPRKKRINRVSIVDQVCSAIKQDIVDGIWKPGDKLPSEAELADTFGVNRLSVRMALQKLITLGIIETRVGEGSYVQQFSLRPFLSEIAVFYDDDEKYHEVQQLRNLLEGECMDLALKNASQEEKEELREVLERYNDASLKYSQELENTDLLDRLVDADFAFHYKLVKMSHNKLYKDVYFMIQQLIRRQIAKLISTRMRKRRDAGLNPIVENDTHNQIYYSIVNADPAGLKKAFEEHLGIVPVKGVDIFD